MRTGAQPSPSSCLCGLLPGHRNLPFFGKLHLSRDKGLDDLPVPQHTFSLVTCLSLSPDVNLLCPKRCVAAAVRRRHSGRACNYRVCLQPSNWFETMPTVAFFFHFLFPGPQEGIVEVEASSRACWQTDEHRSWAISSKSALGESIRIPRVILYSASPIPHALAPLPLVP